jgi:hypothetical protein
MIPFFDPASFRDNPVIKQFDGLDEYIDQINFSDVWLKKYHRLYCRSWGKTPLYCIKLQYSDSSDDDVSLAEDLSLAGELILGHGLIMTNFNTMGGGTAGVHKGLAGATFHASADWKAYFAQTSIGLQLLAMIEGTSQLEYFESATATDLMEFPFDAL